MNIMPADKDNNYSQVQVQFNKCIGLELKKIREMQNLEQQNFAYKVGINRPYYGQIERGEVSISTYLLFKILAACSISLSEFFQNFENNNNEEKR